jgi:hypothetical protein
MRVPRWIVPVIALLFLFGSVGVGKAAGWWQTQGADLRTLDGATPADIRGSSTLAQVSDAFGIPMAELLPLLGLPEDTAPSTPLKELEAYNEVSAVRDLVAVHLGLPPTGEVAPLSGEPAATTATATPAVPAAEVVPAAEAAPAAETAPEITGSTTLQQVSDASGMPLELLYEKLSLPASVAPQTSLRDLKTILTGFEVETVRTLVAEYLAGQ